MDPTTIFAPQPTNQINRPFNLGKVFFVDTYGPSASDSNEGTDPNRPLKKVQVACDKCADGQNDYVMILDAFGDDTEPIVPAKERIHIIGINNSPFPMWVVMVPGTDESVFKLGEDDNHTEIAGINFGGGANHGGIELGESAGGPHGIWIHNCVMGSEFPGGETPKYGIFNVAPNGPVYCLIEDNWFYGTTGLSVSGKIDDTGILLYGAKGTIIRRNVINGIPGPAISLANCEGTLVLNNQIFMGADTASYGIKLVSCLGCGIDGNRISFGETDPSNGYSDDGSNVNNWGLNYRGDTAVYTT